MSACSRYKACHSSAFGRSVNVNKTRKAQDFTRSPLPKPTSFTSMIKKVEHSYESPTVSASSKHLSKSSKQKVKPNNMKFANSPSSVLHFHLSSSSDSSSGKSVSEERKKIIFNKATCGLERKIKSSGRQKPDQQIPKEISKNRMMSSHKKRPKGGCGSLQAKKDNVINFEDRVNDFNRRVEAIDLERDVVEVKDQPDSVSFGDDNLQLIDLSMEDDCLIPFPYRESLEDLQSSAIFDYVNTNMQSESRRESLSRKSLAWDNAFFTSEGLLNREELFLINNSFKETPIIKKGGKRSNVTTKAVGSQSNVHSCNRMNICSKSKTRTPVEGSDDAIMEDKTRTVEDSKRYQSGGLTSSTSFTSSTTSSTSSKNLSNRKVHKKGTNLISSPSSVLHSPSPFSPASYIDGWLSESQSSTAITNQNTAPVLDFQSPKSKEKKINTPNTTIKSSGLRMPSPRIGFFDMEPGSWPGSFRFGGKAHYGSFQDQEIVCSFGNRLDDLTKQLEVINLEQDVLQVKGQRMYEALKPCSDSAKFLVAGRGSLYRCNEKTILARSGLGDGGMRFMVPCS